MFNKKTYLLVISSAALLFNSQALADNQSSLKNRIEKLESKIEQLEEKNDFKVASKIKNLQLSSYAQLDGNFHNEKTSATSKNDEFKIKLFRIALKGNVSEDFAFKLENDFANSDSNIKDAYIKYTGINNNEIVIGQIREPFSIGEAISSKNTTFIARSEALDLTPSRSVGIRNDIFSKNNDWLIAFGIFGQPFETTSATDDTKYSISSRTAYSLKSKEGDVPYFFNIGLSGSYRSLDRDDSNSQTTIDNEKLLGTELVFAYRNALFASEYIYTDREYGEDSNSGVNTDHYAYYVEGSYFINGQVRSFDHKNKKLSSVKVNNPVDQGGLGVFEIAARYARLDLNNTENNIVIDEGDTKEAALGFNWYLNNYLRFSLNYSKIEINKENSADQKFDRVSSRLQVAF